MNTIFPLIFFLVIFSGCSSLGPTSEQEAAPAETTCRDLIQVDAFFLSDSQTNELSGDDSLGDEAIEQIKAALKTYEEISQIDSEEQLHLFLLLKNTGRQSARGKIRCQYYNGHNVFDVNVPHSMSGFSLESIPVDKTLFTIKKHSRFAPNKDSIPKVSIEWLELSTK